MRYIRKAKQRCKQWDIYAERLNKDVNNEIYIQKG